MQGSEEKKIDASSEGKKKKKRTYNFLPFNLAPFSPYKVESTTPSNSNDTKPLPSPTDNTICETYCNENLVLHKPIALEFITTTCIDFFVVAITPITMTLVVIATTYFVVLSLFSCSVILGISLSYTQQFNSKTKRTNNLIIILS